MRRNWGGGSGAECPTGGGQIGRNVLTRRQERKTTGGPSRSCGIPSEKRGKTYNEVNNKQPGPDIEHVVNIFTLHV